MAQCSALSKRSGERCKKHAPKGHVVCSMHGGKSPRGVDSPSFKTGRHSRYLPDRLTEKYCEALADEELLRLDDEIADGNDQTVVAYDHTVTDALRAENRRSKPVFRYFGVYRDYRIEHAVEIEMHIIGIGLQRLGDGPIVKNRHTHAYGRRLNRSNPELLHNGGSNR